MAKPKLYGADYSVYVRIVRLALAQKDVDHDLVSVDIFAEGGPPAWYRDIHPFGRIPAFEHDGLSLIETTAISRYVDEAFAGQRLQPDEPRSRAVMNQIIAALDSYAYRSLVWDIYVERVSKPARGESPNEGLIASALIRARTVLSFLDRVKVPGPWLLGDRMTLADLHAAPMFGYFTQAAEGIDLLRDYPALSEWWTRMSALPIYRATEPSD